MFKKIRAISIIFSLLLISCANKNVISVEEAKKIAVSDASLNENDVSFTKVKQDHDDGILNWEIEFIANDTKYEYEINANNGSILKFEKKSVSNNGNVANVNQNATNTNQNANAQGIDVEKAKLIAVQSAGLDINNVTFIKQKYDIDDGIAQWEIEFVANNNKYEYEINASDGRVLKYETESIQK